MDLPLLCLITRGYFWKLKRIFDHALLRARVFWTWLKLLGVRWVFQSKNMVVGTASHTDSTIRCFKPRNMGLIVKHGFATIQFGNGTNCDSIRAFAKVGECGNIIYIWYTHCGCTLQNRVYPNGHACFQFHEQKTDAADHIQETHSCTMSVWEGYNCREYTYTYNIQCS